MSARAFKIDCDVCVYGDVKKTIEYAVRAEKYGFPAVSIPDHLFHLAFTGEPIPWDAYTLLGALAARTNRVQIMPIVTDVVRRHPVIIAQAFSTLDHISKGRIALGLGAGETYNIKPLTDIVWHKPFTRLKESVALIKELWISDNPVTFVGECINVRNAAPIFKPLQKPHPPIYIGGMGPRIRRLVGKVADGWMPWVYTPEAYREDVKEIEREVKEVGRSMDEIDFGLNIRAIVLKDGEEARKIAAPSNRRCLALRPRLLESSGYPELAKEAQMIWSLTYEEEQINRISRLASMVSEELIEKTAIVGTPDEAIEQIEKFKEAGVTLLAITLMTVKFEETLKAFAEKILPYFAEK